MSIVNPYKCIYQISTLPIYEYELVKKEMFNGVNVKNNKKRQFNFQV
jgi:hypothetical protein